MSSNEFQTNSTHKKLKLLLSLILNILVWFRLARFQPSFGSCLLHLINSLITKNYRYLSSIDLDRLIKSVICVLVLVEMILI